jgi:cytochrome c oxidase subunit 1
MFLASIFTPWAVIVGAVPIAITLTAWFWPKGKAEEEAEQ